MRFLQRTAIFIIVLEIYSCHATIDVEYPVFPKTKAGRQLQNFIGTRRNVGLVVEKPDRSVWSRIFEDSSFIDQIPSKVFEAFSKEGYYRLIDVSKTPDLLAEIANSLTGLTRNRLEIGRQLQADMFLYIGYKRPATSCGSEMRMDFATAGIAVVSVVAGAGNVDVARPTAYRDLLIPLDATLVVTETGQTMKSVVTKAYRYKTKVGTRACPSPLAAFSDALDKSAKTILDDLSPKVKTEKIRILTKDKDEDVREYLKEGLEEAKGENPSMDRAFKHWQKADRVAKGKSEAALGNIGAYYFSIGDFTNAVKYFEKAMDLRGKHRSYYRSVRKKADAAARVDDRNGY